MNDAYTVGIETLNGDATKKGTIYRDERDNLVLKTNTLYSLKIKSKHSPPRSIPAGDLYLYFSFANDALKSKIVKLCDRHQRLGAWQCIMSTISTDMSGILCDSNAYGYHWKVGGNQDCEYSTTCMFTCPSFDNCRSKLNTGYAMHILYSGGFANRIVLPDFRTLKIKSTLRVKSTVPAVTTVSLPRTKVPAVEGSSQEWAKEVLILFREAKRNLRELELKTISYLHEVSHHREGEYYSGDCRTTDNSTQTHSHPDRNGTDETGQDQLTPRRLPDPVPLAVYGGAAASTAGGETNSLHPPPNSHPTPHSAKFAGLTGRGAGRKPIRLSDAPDHGQADGQADGETAGQRLPGTTSTLSPSVPTPLESSATSTTEHRGDQRFSPNEHFAHLLPTVPEPGCFVSPAVVAEPAGTRLPTLSDGVTADPNLNSTAALSREEEDELLKSVFKFDGPTGRIELEDACNNPEDLLSLIDTHMWSDLLNAK